MSMLMRVSRKRKMWLGFMTFYTKSDFATKRLTNFKETYDHFIPLIPNAFDPFIWGVYQDLDLDLDLDQNTYLRAIYNVIAHMVEVGGLGFEHEYIEGTMDRAFKGYDLSLSDPAILSSEFGIEFQTLHALKFGLQESPMQTVDDKKFRARGYALSADMRMLRKYGINKNENNIDVFGEFFSGARFRFQIESNDNEVILSYKVKGCCLFTTIRNQVLNVEMTV
ncbi:hypothetical protein AB8613_23935 [Vibrio sp. BS-M-Sm-2]|uniref:hypothetical protein n=1 Tax=Vibrio sp. BS-M-Sm-2 TaxID=3241167 RepID=UPI003556F827